MLKASVYQSDKLDAREAVREVVQGLKAQDPDVTRSKVVFAYSSCAYNTPSMLDEFSAQLPDVPVIGNTSFTGIITPKGFVGGDGFLGAMALDDPDMAVGVAAEPKTDAGQDAVELGEKVAMLAMKAAGKDCAPAYYYMAASPAEEEYYVKGITHVIGRVPFFGGSAADNAIAGDWKLYTSSGDFADGVAVAFFYTDKPMSNVYTGAYHETGDVGVVTKVIGNRTLAEIDGVPALEKYAEWRGMDIDSLRGSALLSASVVSPLGVKDRLGDLVAIRHPMAGNDDNTIGLGNKVAKNTAVIRMEATVDELIDSAGKTLGELGNKAGDPGAYLLVHCGGRRAGIGDRIGEVADQLKSAANGVPFLCEFTFGEYGQVDDGANTCGGLMLSFTALGK
ncbi:MAG: FIST C-terminal domain-containing protein [Olsenella sp.]|jgi:hypothetical protein|nr:FIST C-terminal domain-containing protein [Olsenella sp.]